jgi:hypothetical protein
MTTTENNDRLREAAPDLLKALRTLLAREELEADEAGEDDPIWLDEARAAIGKAEGKIYTRKLKTYRVLCAVTRAEWYEIEAPDEEIARNIAFTDGELVKQGDTTNVCEVEVEEVGQ